MKILIISLGGSIIVPEKIDYLFLKNFRNSLKKFYRTHKFAIVCGGGTIARKYIEILKKQGKNEKELSIAGIRATRMNALFLMQIFGKEANDSLPKNMKDIKDNLKKNNVTICGALRWASKSTSDSTAAKLANYLKSDFINITNVSGLYTADPKKNKNAQLISAISWKDFDKVANKIKFKPGEHFVLDQKAAKLIRKHKIPTYIIGQNLKNLESLLKNEKFRGTTIKN
ncbi:MAG: UMP kinase [Nanoarchaeota archaeon]